MVHVYAVDLSEHRPELVLCKCWADASLPSGEPSGESCHHTAVTLLGLCARHHVEILGIPPELAAA